MKKHVLLIAVLLLAGLALPGCQKPPAEEMADAQQALSGTEEVAAQEYAPDALAAAQAALDAANAEVEAQNQRFALVRNYDHAKELLAQAIEKSDAAREAAVAAKEQARNDAETALTELGTSFEEATADLTALGECRRKPKGFAADLEALTGRLEALNAEVAPIEEAVSNESFRSAIASAETLSASLATLRADLQSAREKLGC